MTTDMIRRVPRKRGAPFMTRNDMKMALLVAPLILFVFVTVLVPVGQFLFRAVDNSEIHNNLRATAIALQGWNERDGVPGEAVFAALVSDLKGAVAAGREGHLGSRINQALPATRTFVIKTARLAAEGEFDVSPVREKILSEVNGWSDTRVWSVIAHDNGALTLSYLLTSLDLERGPDGSIVRAAPEKALFLNVLGRTVLISLTVTALCVLLALPVAHVIVAASPRVGFVLLSLVLFPLWTSLLVRTVAWIILLQGDGPVNTALLWLGVTTEPLRLVYTRGSLILTMVQVLLPLMILPILSVLRRLPKDYMRAASSLGATWWQAWRRVQLPMIVPGIMTGSAIVFVFALGYYITPALIGGPREQMLSSFIVFYTDKTLNWGLAAALSIQLLVLLSVAAIVTVLARKAFVRVTA